jgi:hypothetical protein
VPPVIVIQLVALLAACHGQPFAVVTLAFADPPWDPIVWDVGETPNVQDGGVGTPL